MARVTITGLQAEIEALKDINKSLREIVETIYALPVYAYKIHTPKGVGVYKQPPVDPNMYFERLYAIPDSIMARKVGDGKLWMHVKTQGIYQIVGNFQMEATNLPATLYKSLETRVTWGRDTAEFMDGRFKAVDYDPEFWG